MDKVENRELTVAPLDKGTDFENFDCGDADLNEFIRRDSVFYDEKRLAKTYLVFYRGELAGFFSICTDAIRLSKKERLDEFRVGKPHPDYPSIKIARMAVALKRKGMGIGTFMVMKAVGKALDISKEVGCRFITVDAYPENASFYREKCGFIRNLEDESGRNVSMRIDLLVGTKEE